MLNPDNKDQQAQRSGWSIATTEELQQDLNITYAPLHPSIMIEQPGVAEYGTVIRIDCRNAATRNYELVLDTAALHVRQFCRTMTLAQGHLLYEVWDFDRSYQRRLGYLVPFSIASESRKISCRHRAEDWKGLQPSVVRRYEDTWDTVVRAFPRIPVFGARRVVERLVRLRMGSGRDEVDGAVVRYATRNWTSYWIRIQASGVRAEDKLPYYQVERKTVAAVAGRAMEVLETWMEPGVSSARLAKLFEQHGLLHKESQGYGGSVWFH